MTVRTSVTNAKSITVKERIHSRSEGYEGEPFKVISVMVETCAGEQVEFSMFADTLGLRVQIKESLIAPKLEVVS